MNLEFQRKARVTSMPSFKAIKQVAPDAKKFGEGLKIIFRWDQSIYQLLWKHAFLYYGIYISLSCLRRFLLRDEEKRIFSDVAKYCWKNSSSINLAIMVAFFTSTAIQRLFSTLTAMPGTYSTTCTFVMSLKPNIPECRPLIATYARWQVLSWVLTFRTICKPLRRIFPNMVSLQRAGLMLSEEKTILDQEEASGRDTPRPLIVIEWMLLLLRECQEREYFFYPPNVLKNVEALMAYKKKCSNTIKFGLYNIPRPLIQAVVIGVYSLGVMTLLGRESNEDRNEVFELIIDFFPFVPSLQFFVYLSWLTFGRAAVNPFGDDESDINIPKFASNHLEDSLRLQALYDRTFSTIFQRDTSQCTQQATEFTSVDI